MFNPNIGNFGEKSGVNIASFGGGAGLTDIQVGKDASQVSIFKAIDKNKDGVIDQNEFNDFKADLDNKETDGIITGKEADNFLKGLRKKGFIGKEVKKEDLLNFLEQYNLSTKDVQSVKTFEQDGKVVVQITKKDGSIETINPDKSSTIVKQDSDGKTIEESYNADKQLTATKVTDSNGNIEQTEYTNGVPAKKIISENGGASISTILYDETGNPKSKEVHNGMSISNYEYIDGNPRLMKKVMDKGHGLSDEIKYGYDEQGNLSIEGTFQLDADGNIVSSKLRENIGTDDEKLTETEFTQMGTCIKRTETFKNGSNVVTIISKPEKEGDEPKVLSYKATSVDGSTEELCEASDGKKVLVRKDKVGNSLSQQFTSEGKLYRADFTPVEGKSITTEYDGKGNTYITVQPGETLESLAQTFGCTPEDINALNENGNFKVGAKVLVPGEHSPISETIAPRRTVQEMIDDENARVARNRKNYFKQLGVTDFSLDGKKVRLADSIELKHGCWVEDTNPKTGEKNKRFIQATEAECQNGTMTVNGEVVPVGTYRSTKHTGNYTVIGKLSDGDFYMVKDSKGQLYYTDSEFKELQNPEIVENRRFFNKNKNQMLTGIDPQSKQPLQYTKTGKRNANGHEIVVTGSGYTGYLVKERDAAGKMVDHIYYTQRELQVYEASTAGAKGTSFEHAQERLDETIAALEQGLGDEGWVGGLVDKLGYLWGSNNTEEKVRGDIDKYKGQLQYLKRSSSPEEFKSRFEEVFGVKYDESKMRAYLFDQSDENYKAAFGTKNNIAMRVEKYLHSQQVGVATVKGGVTIGATLSNTVWLAPVVNFAMEASDKASSKNYIDQVKSEGFTLQNTVGTFGSVALESTVYYGVGKIMAKGTGVVSRLVGTAAVKGSTKMSGVVAKGMKAIGSDAKLAKSTRYLGVDYGAGNARKTLEGAEMTDWTDYASLAVLSFGKGGKVFIR